MQNINLRDSFYCKKQLGPWYYLFKISAWEKMTLTRDTGRGFTVTELGSQTFYYNVLFLVVYIVESLLLFILKLDILVTKF